MKLTDLVRDLHDSLVHGVESLDDATDITAVINDGTKLVIETIDGQKFDLVVTPHRKPVDLARFNPDDTTREDL